MVEKLNFVNRANEVLGESRIVTPDSKIGAVH